MQTHKEELIDFSGEKVNPDGLVTLHLTLETQSWTQIVKVDFFVVDCPSAYNIILGRSTLNKISAVISPTCITMKFFIDNGGITTVKADQAAARQCYNASLEIQKYIKEGSRDSPRPPSSSKVMMVHVDARQREEKRPELGGKLEEVQIGKEHSQ